MLPASRALRAAGLLRPPGADPLTGAARRARCGTGQRPVWRGFALPAGPDLRHFLRASAAGQPGPSPELPPEPGSTPGAPKVYLETYGCQMNVSDTEIVWAILQKNGYARTKELGEADVVLLVTCSVREKAEQAIWNRLQHLKALKARRPQARAPLRVGILGCMAERLKEEILHREKLVDVVAGPDAYRDLSVLKFLRSRDNLSYQSFLPLPSPVGDKELILAGNGFFIMVPQPTYTCQWKAGEKQQSCLWHWYKLPGEFPGW